MEPTGKSAEKTALISDVAMILPGEFHLLDYLGEGGHGIVFKAIFKPLQTQVALKLIKQDDPETMVRELERMQNEARILAKLQHPNIIKVFQMAKCTDGTPFLVCEYIKGETLSTFLQNFGPLNLEEIKSVFCQMLDALQVSHEHGLIHRDIKPNNIILSREKPNAPITVKVLDFGIARDLSEGATKGNTTTLGLTRTIQVTGSAPYMSPEQCKGAPIDPRTDIYSVACVLFECLAGRPPFIGETPIHTRYMHIHEQAKQPSEETDEHIREKSSIYKLVLKSLSKDPNGRPQTAAEFKAELLEACASSKFDKVASKRRTGHSQKVPIVARPGLIALMLGAVLISLVTLAGISFYQLSKTQKGSENIVKKSDSPDQIRVVRRADLVDPSHQLRSAYMDIGKLVATPPDTFEARRLQVQAWEKVDRAISRIDKSDKTTLFVAWIMRGNLAHQLDIPSEVEPSYQNALKYCQVNGRPTLEASQCYLELATEIMRKDQLTAADLSEAEMLAEKTLLLREQNEKNELPTLQIPSNLDVREKITELVAPLLLLGSIANKRNDRANSLKYYQRAFEQQAALYGWGGAHYQARLVAEQLGSMEKAEQFMSKYLDDLIQTDTGGNFNAYVATLQWVQRNSNPKFADNCVTRIIETLDKNNYMPPRSESQSYKTYLELYKRIKARKQ